MLKDIYRTIAQLPDPRFLKVLAASLALAALLYAGLFALVAWALTSFSLFDLAWLDTLIDLLGGLLFAWIAILLFPSFAMAIQGLLLEGVAAAVESRHYPGLPPPRSQSWAEVIGTTARIVLLTLAVNLLLLPVYLALTFVPPLNLALFYLVNGWLLGREYFETVALRRMEPRAARALHRANRGAIWLTGAAIAAMFSIPLLNLAAPVLGTALMLHRFERLRAKAGLRDAEMRSRSAPAIMMLLALAAAAAHLGPAPQTLAPQSAALPPRITERAAPPAPEELLGLWQTDIAGRLGPPALVRRDGPARVWQYASEACVLDLFLYAERGDFRVAYVKTRARRAGEAPGPWCYADIIESGRSARTEAAAAR